MKKVKFLTRTILLVSFVSLFNDISSEMLYPVIPVFLQSIGFTTILIGILEGLAASIAGISNMYFGRRSDEMGKRIPFVRWGYLLSAISKSLPAVSTLVPVIFLSRTLDRFGKGIRTSARDAILSDESLPETKGRVFGFHRAMDTVGAAIGPLVALIFLQFFPQQYQPLFLIAFVPSVFSIALTWVIHEKKNIPSKPNATANFFEKFFYWKNSPKPFRLLMIALLGFALVNSSDFFLLLRAKQVTGNDSILLIAYIFYNLVYAFVSYPAGRFADFIGLKKVLGIGLLIFSLVYGGMALLKGDDMLFVLFFFYGVYAAATDGIAKALISNIVPKTETATAIGFYTGWTSIFALIASTAAGVIWNEFSAEATFAVSAVGSFAAAIFLLSVL